MTTKRTYKGRKEYMQRHRAEMREAGKCTTCGKAAGEKSPGVFYAQCGTHRDMDASRQRKAHRREKAKAA